MNTEEENLKKNNPWVEIAERFKGNEILFPQKDDKLFVCPKDLSTLEAFNRRLHAKSTEDYERFRYVLTSPAYPWVGNPLKAKVIILSLNPAYADRVDAFGNIMRGLSDQNMVGVYAEHQHKTLLLEADSLWPSGKDDINMSPRMLALFHGCFYWYNRIKSSFFHPERVHECTKDLTMEQVEKNLAIVQLVGYTSVKFCPFRKNEKLASMDFTKKLITYLASKEPKNRPIFLVLRARSEWEKLLVDVYTDDCFHDIGNRNQSFSEKVMSKNALFEEVIKRLKG